MADSRNLAAELLRSRDRWIPVTERLPEKEGQYICWFDHGGYMAFDTFRDGGWMTKAHIAAWMPLPEPPKEEENVSAD